MTPSKAARKWSTIEHTCNSCTGYREYWKIRFKSEWAENTETPWIYHAREMSCNEKTTQWKCRVTEKPHYGNALWRKNYVMEMPCNRNAT